jgi:hypothetical protein
VWFYWLTVKAVAFTALVLVWLLLGVFVVSLVRALMKRGKP